ncbi:MAG: hypothetical protein ACRD9S_04545 [Pyrinomonadaceae bacterium]
MLFPVDQTEVSVEPAAFAKGGCNGEPEGEGNGDGVGRIDGDGVGKIDGDGSAVADGDGLGRIEGEGSGDGEGNGSPTCLTRRGANGLRCDRNVEGIAGGVTGADG